jgi:iron complex transport system permease protein
MAEELTSLDEGRKTRSYLLSISLIALLLVFFLVDLFTGPVSIPMQHVFALIFKPDNNPGIWHSILFDFRLPKAITAVMAGSSLAVSGLQMQTVFRNPLAGPDVLGISSGASLGVALVILGFGSYFEFNSSASLSSWMQIIAAWIGSGIVLFLVLFISLRIRDIMTILILGILFGSAASAVVSILQYFSNQSMLKAFVVWSMGNLGNLTGSQLQVLCLSLLIGFILTLFSMRVLNVLLLGENYSRSMGVNIRFTRFLVFASTSILSGSITAFCGPLAFVGIVVPHLARMIFRTADHRWLIPACFVLGALLMLLADLISQFPGSQSVLPINSVTAILGIPVVIWVIVSNRRLVNIS